MASESGVSSACRLDEFFILCYCNFAAVMASQSCVSSAPKATQVSRQQEYYPLWKYVTKVKQMGSGGTWEWKCNLCKNEKTFQGSYTRVKAHILHEEIKGIDVCAHTKNAEVRAKFKKESVDAQS